MSTRSPCSVPWFLRPLVPREDATWQLCCALHDVDYQRGTVGDYRGQFIADVKFLLRMLEYGVDPTWAEMYYQAVRTYGMNAYGTEQMIAWPAPLSHVETP